MSSPRNARWQQDLALSIDKTGDTLLMLGDFDAALESQREALTIRQQLASEFPNEPELENVVAQSHNNLGIALKELGPVGIEHRHEHDRQALTQPLTNGIVARFSEKPEDVGERHRRRRLVAVHLRPEEHGGSPRAERDGPNGPSLE